MHPSHTSKLRTFSNKRPPKSAQEVFDAVVSHLVAQGKPALQNGECKYRTIDGLKCAVGCLIPNKDYRKSMDETNVAYNGKLASLLPRYEALSWIKPHEELLNRLQMAHDGTPDFNDHYEGLAKQLRRIAIIFNLDASCVPNRF